MKISELRERSVADLAQLELELGRDLWKTRFSNYTNQLDDTAKMRRLRREIARIKTIITQKNTADQTAKAKG
jgi:large subunit ribosomal protein L29